MRLLKLLYIADREAFKETCRPIVGGRQVAMDRGPVPSRAYDAIKGCDPESLCWSSFIETQGYKVRLVHDPGMTKLTKYEAAKLVQTAEAYAALDEWDLSQYTHQFPEYLTRKPAKGSSQDITWEDIAEALGMSQRIASIERYEQERAEASAALGRSS